MGIDKKSFFPVYIKQKFSKHQDYWVAIHYVRSHNLPNPTTQIVKYIDTYTLLPLENEVFAPAIDIRDSLIGKMAPEFSLEDFSGHFESITNFRGKVILLDYWEIWCGPCRMTLSYLEELYDQLHSKGLVIIGITKDNPVGAPNLIKQKGIKYINLKGNENIYKQ